MSDSDDLGPRAEGDFKSYLEIVYRRRWWIGIPLLLSVVASAALLIYLPKIYRASTTILVTPQRLPEQFLSSSEPTELRERVAALAVQVLSRSYLDRVVREFGFVPTDADSAAVEQAGRRLTNGVQLEYDERNYSWFRIVVDDKDPVRAAGVANRLADLFIEQNTSLREEHAADTRGTIEGWLATKQDELNHKEAEIAAYRQAHMWELPGRLPVNMELLRSFESRVETANAEIRSLERQLVTLRAQVQTESVIRKVSPELSGAAQPDRPTLAELEHELEQLLLRYTEKNPYVRAKRAEIERYKELAAAGELGGADGTSTDGGFAGPLQEEIAGVRARLKALQQERRTFEEKIGLYQARIDITPVREQELSILTRDLDKLREIYEGLLEMKEQAARAEQLEASKKSEQFQVQDRAAVPTVPFEPKPHFIVAYCLAVGLGLGFGLTVLLEQLNQTIHSEDAFRCAFADVPLLAAIPNLDGDIPFRRRHRSRRRRSRQKAVL